jgi:hypothetical protein
MHTRSNLTQHPFFSMVHLACTQLLTVPETAHVAPTHRAGGGVGMGGGGMHPPYPASLP